VLVRARGRVEFNFFLIKIEAWQPHLHLQQMPRTLLFDTETTGLPAFRNADVFQHVKFWPDIVSICWRVYDGMTLVKAEYHIIRPDDWLIPAESVKFHGITQERAQKEGKPLIHVLEDLKQDLLTMNLVVAHNLEFDKNVLFHAYYWRLNDDPRVFWPSRAEFCSLQKSKWEMKLPGKYPKSTDPYKMPSLDELYTDTFNEPAPENAHSADRDVSVLAAIMRQRWPSLMMLAQ